MKISRILTQTSLALWIALCPFSSLLLPAHAHDAHEDLLAAEMIVDEAVAKITDALAATPDGLESNPELLRSVHRNAEAARRALNAARLTLAEEFGKSVNREDAIRINLALESSGQELREAVEKLPPLKRAEPLDGRMSPERAIEVLKHDAELLSELLELTDKSYSDENIRATLQKRYDAHGRDLPYLDSWSDNLWLEMIDGRNRFHDGLEVIRTYARALSRDAERMNALYVEYLHEAALRLWAEHGRFDETAAAMVEITAREARLVQKAQKEGRLLEPDAERKACEAEYSRLSDIVRNRDLMKPPMEEDEWVRDQQPRVVKVEIIEESAD